jgi:hypothetical protein
MKYLEFILTATFLLTGSRLDAKVFHVDRDFQGENYTGESWLSAFPSVQEAIDAASENGGGEIWIKAGVHKPTGGTRNATFKLKPNVELYGGFRGNETVLSQRNPKASRTILSGDIGRIGTRTDNSYHVIIGAANCRVDGFIVTAGNAEGNNKQALGGALLLDGGSKNFIAANCTFEKNHATTGGAIHTIAAGTSLSNCTFYSNSADLGGAACLGKGAVLRATVCTFSSNFSTQSGGAVAILSGANANFTDSRFLANSTDGEGGAIFSATDKKKGIELRLSECSFKGNSAHENGGAIFNRGAFSPVISNCYFTKNSSSKGAAVMKNRDGASANLIDCSLRRNQSAKGIKDIDNPSTATRPNDERIAPRKSLPAFKPKKKRELEDVFVINTQSIEVKLRSIVAMNDFTVLAMGDLTNPLFLSSYRSIEAAAKDYSAKSVSFFYIYRYLSHPENHEYVQPFNLLERMRHVQDAVRLLHTQIPWVCDTMDNEAARALEYQANTLFIFNKDGVEEYAGNITDETGFRSALKELAGTTETRTLPKTMSPPDIVPINMPEAQVIERVEINPKQDQFLPLQVIPLKSRTPFFVKMRAEASKGLLETGNGRIYLGFHIDPLYGVEWNNLANTLNYAIKVPHGMAVSPSINQAEKVSGHATDPEPREFMLEARKWNLSLPLTITVSYSVHASTSKKTHNISQQYTLYLDRDPFGGSVIGRGISKADVLKKGTEPPKRAARTSTADLPRHLDLDLDGMLSRDEAPRALLKHWDEIDQNKDGRVNEEEYRLFLEM